MGLRIFSAWSLVGLIALVALAIASSSCGSSNTKPGAPGSPISPGSSPPPPGSPSSGGFAAGIGGAGQNSAAHFLIATQVPGSTPFPTVIGSNGTLTAAKATANPVGETNPMGIVGAIDPSGSFLYQADWSGLTAFTIDRQTGNVTEMSTSPYEASPKFDGVAVISWASLSMLTAEGKYSPSAFRPASVSFRPLRAHPSPPQIQANSLPARANEWPSRKMTDSSLSARPVEFSCTPSTQAPVP
jgi:hypothetical protein